MTSVRDALTEWFEILNRLPPGQPIDIVEEGASPGEGAPAVVAQIVRPDLNASVLMIVAGAYDGEPRIFARVFKGTTDEVGAAGAAWRKEIEGSR